MGKERASDGQFSLADFGIRLLGATGLVLATYNPSGYSYVAWIRDAWQDGSIGPVHYFFAVVLLIGWIILLRATFNSLGILGLILGTALLATLVWMLVDFGLLKDASVTVYTWISLICISVLLALGLCWSHIWRRLTGQVDVDDFDND